jgi:hypothetical protein
LPGLLLSAGGDDNDVGVFADRHVVRTVDPRHRHKLKPVDQVEHLGVDFRAI